MTSSNCLKTKSLTIIISFFIIGLYFSCSKATTHSIKEKKIKELNSIQLIDYNSASYGLKKFEYVRECILNNHLSNDTLTLELLSENMQFSQKPEIKFILHNDTLNITVQVKTVQKKDTKIYNKKEKKYETMHTFEMQGDIHVDMLAPKGKIETFRFKGFKKCPTTIYLNGIYYKKFQTKDIESKTYNGNIINRINMNGFKDGVWLEFYETGELREKKYYENGSLINGKTFDKNGKDLHYVSESSGSIVSFQTDSLFNK